MTCRIRGSFNELQTDLDRFEVKDRLMNKLMHELLNRDHTALSEVYRPELRHCATEK